jgi:hypothetical protein
MAMNRLVPVFFSLFCIFALACNGGGGGLDAGDGDVDGNGDGNGDGYGDDGGGDEGTLPMEVGEIAEIPPDAQGIISTEIAAPNGDESFILVLYSAAWEPAKEYGYSVTVTPPPGGGILKTKKRNRGGMLAHLPPHRPLLLGDRRPVPPVPPGPPPTVGEQRSFQVLDETNQVQDIQGECVQVGGSLAVWLDRTTNDPAPAAIDPDMANDISDGFQNTVLLRHHIFFGQESDVDSDGLFHLLYTPLFASSGVIAFVSYCDLVNLFGCPIHNNMELVYATPPDQISNPMMNSVSSILEVTAHETQHSIYYHRKFMLNNLTYVNENPYVTEALSALAEDLSGYGNGTFYVWAHTLDYIMDISGPDLLDGSVESYDPGRDAALRGGGYLLYRYLFEQAGGNEFAEGNQITDLGGIAFLNALIDSPELGQANLEQLTSRSITDILFDWYTTLAVSNRKRTDDTPLNGPLTGPVMTDVSAADGQIRAGGVDYLRLAAGQAGTAFQVEITGEVGSDLRLRIVRVD